MEGQVPEEIFKVICNCGLEVAEEFTKIIEAEKNIVFGSKTQSLYFLNEAKKQLASVSKKCGIERTVPEELLNNVMDVIVQDKWDQVRPKMNEFKASLIDQLRICK